MDRTSRLHRKASNSFHKVRSQNLWKDHEHSFGRWPIMDARHRHTTGRKAAKKHTFCISRHTNVSSNSTVFSSFFPWTKRWTTPRKLLPPNLRWNQKLQTKSKLMNQMDGVESSGDTYVVGLDSAAAQLHQTLVNTQVMIFTNRVMLVNINKPFMKY